MHCKSRVKPRVTVSLAHALAPSADKSLWLIPYIHAVEAPSTPQRAQAAADTLANLIPGAGHLVHMPAHIYWRVGRYHDTAEANVRAAAVIGRCHSKTAPAGAVQLTYIAKNYIS